MPHCLLLLPPATTGKHPDADDSTMFLVPRNNQALNINPPAGDEHLTTGGSDWLWAVTAVFALAFVSHHPLPSAHHDNVVQREANL